MVKNDYVVVLHGIFRTSKHMRKLAGYIASRGYEVLNLDYPSTKRPLEELVDTAWRDISVKLREEKSVHFVGYSMGGLLVRAILSRYRPLTLGRVVLLAAPNKGSEVADFMKNNRLYKKLYGPAGQQLITDQSAIAHLFKDIDYDCGVIAGNLSLDPLSSFIVGRKADGKVSIESTRLDGMKDHVVIRSTHTWFPHNKKAQSQTVHFLRHGFFER